MIDEVAKLLKEQIDMSVREQFDAFNRHTYSYTKSVCSATLTRYLIGDWKTFTDGFSSKDFFTGRPMGEVLTDDLLTITGTSTVEAAMRMAADEAMDVVLDPESMYTSWKGIFRGQGSDIKILREDFSKQGSSVKVKLEVGTVIAKGTAKKNNKLVPVNLVNLCTKDFYKRAKREAFHWIRIKGAIGGANRNKNTEGKTLRGIGGKGSDNFRPVKAHGKAQAWQGEAEVSAAGKYQTTVGVLALTKMMDKAEAVSISNTKYSADIYNSVATVEKQFRDMLEKRFDLKQYRNVSTKEFDEEIVIDLHATDSKGNKEFEKGKFDRRGINKAMENKGKDIARNLAKELGIKKNTEEWKNMKASKPRRQIMEDQVKKILVEKLLKVKGTRPDFRLKVNKKLLAQAKKDTKLRRTKKGITLTKKTKSKSVKKAAVAGAQARFRRSAGKSIDKSKTAVSPISLRNILNEYLPQMVASKMTPPALQFRTGRFANSARVENVDIGPRGGIGVDYTYMRDPYETFEPGNKQGSTQRDPRKIIGASIRELAMGILGRQPTTIRRT